jgi:hypothetical protein
MKIRSLIFVAVILSGVPVPAWATEVEAIHQYNEAVERIYNQIEALKDRYPELANFSRSVIKQNPDGFKEISYAHKVPYASWNTDEDPYGLNISLHVEKLEQGVAEITPDSPEWRFNLLGFKVVLDVSGRGQLTAFDPQTIVRQNIEELSLLEQNVLPFRLELTSDKDVYAPDEAITLTVTLQNLGLQPFRVFDLDEHSLFCQIDDMVWGSLAPKEAKEKVLTPNGAITRILRVRGISQPKATQISCRYGIGFRGVLPYNRIKVIIKSAS